MNKNNIDNIYPLTPLQQGMLYDALKAEDSEVYLEQISIELNGKIKRSIAEKSFQLLIERYDVLRASIVHQKTPKPLHIIKSIVKPEFNFSSLKNESKNKEEFLAEFKLKDKKRGFNFNKGPLIRLSLIELAENKNIILFTFHHIILDGWSFALLLGEFYKNYAYLNQQKEINLTKPPQFNTYLKYLEKLNQKDALNYWKKYLENFETVTSFSKKTIQETNFTYTIHEFNLSKEAKLGVTSLMEDLGVTFPTVMQFIWGVLLARLTGTKDVVFGTVVSGRNVPIDSIDKMIGMLINTIPVRIQFGEETLNQDLLSHKTRTLESLTHQYCSLSEIKSLVKIPDLFDQLIVFENYPTDDFGEEAIKITNITASEKTSYRFLVNMMFGDEIAIKVNFDESCYSKEMIYQIEGILNFLTANISKEYRKKTISTINILPEKTKNQLNAFNNTSTNFPQETLVSLFKKQLNNFPKKIAVKDTTTSWTVSELNDKSIALAQKLLDLGVNEEEPVCVHVNRSNYMMASLLGIMMSRAAYVPIDTSLPEARQAYIMKNCNARFLVKIKSQETYFPWMDNYQIIETDNLQQQKSTEINLPIISPNQLAYIIYTSGSTGNPKGVMVSHQSVNNRLQWLQKEYPLNSDDILIQKTNYAFDVSVGELFGWMFEGASLYFLTQGDEKDPDKIFNELADRKITRVHFVPSMLTVFLEYIAAFKDCTKLKNINYFLSSGEKLTKENIISFNKNIYPKTRAKLLNLYGPTEAAIEVTSFLCPTNYRETAPIGKPIANTKIHVVDDDLNILPPEFSGQICIEGIQLARGYIANNELTESVFLKSPFNAKERIYLTGDIGKWNAKGEIIYLDRKDSQIKIRGYRVELDEINNSIKNIVGIENIKVLVDDKKANKELIGFCTGNQISQEYLVKESTKVLPKYMVPSKFIILDKWPVMPNGKTDITVLRKQISNNKISANNKEENGDLANIWKTILKLNKISTNDDFFTLGGQSLLAITLIAKIQKQFSVKISIKEVFTNSTYRDLEKLIASKSKSTSKEIEIYTGDKIPMTGAQKRLFILNQLFSQDTAYNIPSVWIIDKVLQKNKLEIALKKVVEKHKILQTRFYLDEETGFFGQEINHKGDFNIKLEHKTLKEDIKKFAKTELQKFTKPFDLNSSKLFNLKVITVKEEKKSLLFFDIHHIIFDGPSFQVFFQDLFAFYKEEKVEKLKFQYKDYAFYTTQILTKKEIENLKCFWQKQYEPGIPVLNFSESKNRRDAKKRFGKVITKRITQTQKDSLTHFAQSIGVTLNQLFLANLILLLIKKSNQKDIVVGTVVSGRDEEETKNMIGMFANTIAIPFFNNENWTLQEFFKYSKNQIVAAIDHKEYPFDDLVNILEIKRDTTRTPLFDVLYSMQNVVKNINDLNEETIVPVQLTEKPVSYDLSFFVNEYEKEIDLHLEYDKALFYDAWAVETVNEWLDILGKTSTNFKKSIKEFCNLKKVESKFQKNKLIEKSFAKISAKKQNNADSKIALELKQVWESLTNKKILTGEEDFFKEGGHSILAVRLSILFFKKTNIKISLLQIFKTPKFNDLVSFATTNSSETYQVIPAIETASYYDLSAAQKRLWITNELSNQKNSYNIASVYVFKGKLDVNKIQQAFQEVVNENEILRSYYKQVDEAPKMFFKKHIEVAINLHNFMHQKNPEGLANDVCEKVFNQEFNLTELPLFKIDVIKTDHNKHWLSLVIHHIITDGWSNNLIMQNVVHKYNDVPYNIEIPKVQYKDFSAWQNNNLNKNLGEKLKNYWTERFENLLDINIDKRKNNTIVNQKSDVKVFFVDKKYLTKIDKLTKANHWSRYQLLLGSLGYLLSKKHLSKEQIILLSDTGRVHPDLDKVMGFFINIVPFRYSLQNGETYKTMINRTKKELITDLEHAQYPLEDILKEIKKASKLNNQDILQTRLVYNDFDYGETLNLKGITAEEKRIASNTGKFDLNVIVGPIKDELCVQIEYNKKYYQEENINTIFNSWMNLLQEIEENPNKKIQQNFREIKKATFQKMGLNQLKNIEIETIEIKENE